MTYAPEHEKELFHRSYRRRMALSPVLRPSSETPRTTQDPRHSRDPKRRLLRVEEWLSPWRLLPRDFPPWESVYFWFRRWRIDGTWERLNAALRERVRIRLGRNVQPSAGIVDSQ